MKRSCRRGIDAIHRRDAADPTAAPDPATAMALTILGVAFFGLLLLGVPVAFAIGLSALATIVYEGLPMAVIFQQKTSGMNVF